MNKPISLYEGNEGLVSISYTANACVSPQPLLQNSMYLVFFFKVTSESLCKSKKNCAKPYTVVLATINISHTGVQGVTNIC